MSRTPHEHITGRSVAIANSVEEYSITLGPIWRCGYGACSKCNCQHYEGSAWTCANRGCGHAYQDHW